MQTQHPEEAVQICDAFEVPPHVLLAGYPRHRYTWRVRRWFRMRARR